MGYGDVRIIHYVGHFKASQYVGGVIRWVDNCTKDYMSMLDLYEAVTVLGVQERDYMFLLLAPNKWGFAN